MQRNVARTLKHVSYVILSAVVIVRDAWLRWKQFTWETWDAFIASFPRIESLLALLIWRRRGAASQRGSKPRAPTVLGAVVIQTKFGPHEDQALCRLIAWAHRKKFHQLLLYDPAGDLQNRKEELVQGLQWIDSSSGSIVVWAGWQPPPEFELKVVKTVTGGGGDAGHEMKGSDKQVLGVALLSAADTDEVLEKSANTRSGHAGYVEEEEERLKDGGSRCRAAALTAAVSAPLNVKTRFMDAAGPLAGVEPDFVVVFGSALTLAGFPPWAVRTAEVFEVGPLAGVTSGKMDAVLRRFLGTRQRFGK